MAELDKRSFDVTRPKQVGAEPTSKPIIVGHHPMMTDPTVRDTNIPLMDHTVEPPKATKIAVSAVEEEAAPEEQPAEPEEVQRGQFGGEQPAPPAEDTEVLNNTELSEQMASPDQDTPPVETNPLESPQEDSSPDTDSASSELQPQPDAHEHQPPATGNDVSTTLEDLHLPEPHLSKPPRRFGSFIFLPLVIMVTLLVVYGLVAAKTDIKLPYNPFNKDNPSSVDTTSQTPQTTAPTNQQPAASNIPTGFSEYKLAGTSVTFDYPTVWGTPKVTTDAGFSKRGGTNKSDGTYAYLIDFADNKDVEMAATSAKLLPPARGTQYYDYLQWCVGTADQKFYKQLMHFTTASQVDAPTTATCDQGPLTDATKLDDSTIVQAATKDPTGKTLGDLYTKNLADPNYVVLRIKDTPMTNADNIKKLLGTVQSSAQ